MYDFSPYDARRFADFMGIETKERGEELVFRFCPYCRNSTSDKYRFSINLTNGKYHCFRRSCGAKGNMLTLARDFNFDLGDGTAGRRGSFKKFREIDTGTKPESKPEAIEYMKKRGISEAITRKYNITVQNSDANVLVFPFYDDKDCLRFVKYRVMNYDKKIHSCKEWAERGCMPILFGMNHCNLENQVLILTEGQIDALSVAEAGIENALSVGTGAKGFSWIQHCWEFLEKFKTIIVFGDYENGEVTLVETVAKRFNGQVKQVRVEDYLDCKDANEILMKHGVDAVRYAVEHAQLVRYPNIIPLADVERINLNAMEHVTTGIKQLDGVLGGFYFGELVVLTGERGDGKSTLASQFATIAVSKGYNVFAYSGELMNWFFKGWMEYQFSGPDHINRIQNENGNDNYSVDASYLEQIENWYRERVYIFDNNAIGTKDEQISLIDTIETAIRQYDCRYLVIDNLMTALVDDLSSDQYRQQTIFVNGLVSLAKKYNVLIILIAHPRKQQGVAFENDDVAGSSNITNLADIVLRYSRPRLSDNQDSDERIMTVHKNRLTGKLNRKGIKMYFDPASKRISDTKGEFTWKLGWEDYSSDDMEGE